MLINKSQANLIHNLRDEIQNQLNVKIGYSSLFGSFVDETDDFIIHEEGYMHEDKGYPDAEVTAIHLVHKHDYSRRHAGILVQEKPNEFPLREEECEKFLKELLTGLENGTITRNPKHSKQFGNRTVTVIKMANEQWDISIKIMCSIGWSRIGFMCGLDELDKKVDFPKEKDQVLETIRELEQLVKVGDL